MKTIKKQFQKLPCKYIELELNNGNYMLFNMTIEDDKFYVTHDSMNKEEEASSLIPHIYMDIDPSFSLDENLEGLIEECYNKLAENNLV